MRIGAITGMNLRQWDSDIVRSVVNKKIPGYPIPGSYDLKVMDKTIKVGGTLVGTSNQDLSNQMNKLAQYQASKRPVWMDASDQYQNILSLGKITNLRIPLVGGEPFTSDFELDFKVLPPWGMSNVTTNNQSNTYFRDLMGILLENIIDPIVNNCNYTIDNVGKSISWEFIIDNQNTFASKTSVTDCETTTGFSTDGTASATSFTTDGVIFKQGSFSVKMTGTSDTSGNMGAAFTNTGLDTTVQDFFVVWVRSDFGGATTGTIKIILSSDVVLPPVNFRTWTYSNLNANQWYRLVVPLRINYSQVGNPTMTLIKEWIVRQVGVNLITTNMWVDEEAMDMGNWRKIEFQIPDNIIPTETFPLPLRTWIWNGSAYVQCIDQDSLGTNNQHTSYYALDGSLMAQDTGSTVFANGIGNGATAFAPALFNQNARVNVGQDSAFNYSNAYGLQNRFALSLKMAPATSDSGTGNLPSEDISGFQAINKARLKVQAFFANEISSYMGF